MNPVFWFLVILFAAAIWLGMAILFKPFGRLIYRIFSDTKEILNEEDDEK